jgi:preprotein translocase subunit SecA
MTSLNPTPGVGLPYPGPVWGDYPQRHDDVEPRRRNSAGTRREAGARRVARVRGHLAFWRRLDDTALRASQIEVQTAVTRHGLVGTHAEACCAYVAEIARRAIRLDAYDGQLLAALQMLDDCMVEMDTGEGKSLAIALAAAMGALAGVPVHVLTANDYLVERDARRFAPLYVRLGLSVAWVLAPDAPRQRRDAYAQAVVYVTAKELAFDYLRDANAHGVDSTPIAQRVAVLTRRDEGPPRVLRGLCMAIVDEADSLLIDEAQTPLILSREAPAAAARAYAWQAWALSERLVTEIDFQLVGAARRVELTQAGREHIATLANALQPVWLNTRHREETLVAALTARHVLQRDRDYLVVPSTEPGASERDAQAKIVDAVTGRIAEGRRWSHGLHALVALKEGCRADAELETIARITFQRLFRRYHRLGGMSGTLREARAELAAVYGLSVVRIAPRLPNLRRDGKTRVFRSDAACIDAIVRRARDLVALSRPVLIGTDTVEHSQRLAEELSRAGLVHALLNARCDADEARIVAEAGRCGRITVSTNMAGRGTDIVPDREALRAGGLHVIVWQHNPSARLDRQLRGRAARQGQPGSSETWLSLEAARFGGAPGWRIAVRVCIAFCRHGETHLPSSCLRALHRLLQRLDDRAAAQARRRMLRAETERERALAFNPGL